jgi:hypothetical protein
VEWQKQEQRNHKSKGGLDGDGGKIGVIEKGHKREEKTPGV